MWLLVRLLRSRVLWRVAGVVTVASVAFWLIAAVMVATMAMLQPLLTEREADEVAGAVRLAGLGAAMLAVAGLALLKWASMRARTRQFVPVHQAMLRDGDIVVGAHLVRIQRGSDADAGGRAIAADMLRSDHGPLWLPGGTYPRGTVVCYTDTPAGPQVRAWMTRRLWKACERASARAARCAAKENAQVERYEKQVAERRVRDAAKQVVSAAEQILQEHDRS